MVSIRGKTTAAEKPFLQVKSLHVTYRQGDRSVVDAVKDANLEIYNGEFAVVIGPSGCGKTTLLYVLAGLTKPDAGHVYIQGEEVLFNRRDTALILQDYGLLPWKNVEQNVTLGLRIREVPPAEARKKTQAVLSDLGIEDLATRFPAQLSGGQRQRVAIARAMALNPALLLMDEPFSSLDELTRETLQGNLLGLWQKSRVTIVLVTHNIEEAVFLGQKIFVMSRVPGTITHVVYNHQAGNPEYRGRQDFYDQCAYIRSLLQ